MVQHNPAVQRLVSDERRKWSIGRFGFAVGVLSAEFAMIVGIALATGITYHLAAYAEVGEITNFLAVGVLTALLFLVPIVLGQEYKLEDFLDGRRGPGRAFLRWNYVFLSLFVIGFLTKTSGLVSRGWVSAFYLLGLCAVIALNIAVSRGLELAIAKGLVASRRLMLIGDADEVERMAQAVESPKVGFRVVASVSLPLESKSQDSTIFRAALTDAVDKARMFGVEDVVILTDWTRHDRIHELVESFSVLPAAIHLGASGIIDRFSDARLARFGHASALLLTSQPLSPQQTALKRLFDIAAAGFALVLLSPVFVVIAILIKRDSQGPVFFRQRRRGYNLVEFRIWKFRTMTSQDDGPVIAQARPGDARITRVGAVLRRYNLDELPQLINVVLGDMSLVGPRPHAVAHDELYEQRITKYRRRLNVLPGITGWAQVNGLRGLTETDELMRARVEHDLYYIDHWSIWFDLYVIAATILSRKAFRNAG